MQKRPFIRKLSPFAEPQKLTHCRYELRTWQYVRKTITTTSINREAAIRTLIEFGCENIWHDYSRKKSLPFCIYIKERNKPIELLLDSSVHCDFMLLLLGKRQHTYE